jgi:hypothetical protein
VRGGVEKRDGDSANKVREKKTQKERERERERDEKE